MSAPAKVVSLTGDDIASPGHPSEPLITALEQMLEQARSGEICGMAVAILHTDGGTGTRLHGYARHHAALGAIEELKLRLLGLV